MEVGILTLISFKFNVAIISSGELHCDSQKLCHTQLLCRPSALSLSLSSLETFCSNAISSEVYGSIDFKFYVKHPGLGLY